MKFCNLASGSKGNCSVITSGSTSILIDDGISYKELQKRCDISGIDLSTIKAVFISHEHDDHVVGLKTLLKKYEIPVYIHPKSLNLVQKKVGFSFRAFINDFSMPICIDDLQISAFRVSHDALYTQGFLISDGNKTITMATDLGYISDHIFSKLLEGDYVFLESNYDYEMLLDGAYPYYLKTRIHGKQGHLSNYDASNAIVALARQGKSRFMLAHLSQNNNTKEMVLSTLSDTLEKAQIAMSNLDVIVASQDIPTKVIEI